MKIAKVKLQNFQSHENSIIEFSPGFNVIIGKTNHGKSSIFRALRHALFDVWNKRYVRTGHKNYNIEIEFDTGDKLIRIRGEKNQIKFISANGEKHEFESFGESMPLKVKELLKLPDFKIDIDKEINTNIAAQQDPLFLISSSYSAPLVSKFFSRLSGIHIIDAANRNIDKNKKTHMDEVRSLDDTIGKNTILIKDLEKVFIWKKVIDSKIKEAGEIQEKARKQESLIDLQNRLKQFTEKRKKLEKLDGELQKIDIIKIDSFLEKAKTLTTHSNLHVKVVKLKSQLGDVSNKILKYSTQLDSLEEEKKEFLSTLTLCPFCGSKIESGEKCHI